MGLGMPDKQTQGRPVSAKMFVILELVQIRWSRGPDPGSRGHCKEVVVTLVFSDLMIELIANCSMTRFWRTDAERARKRYS